MGALETVHITSHDPAPPPVSYVKVSGGLFKDMAIHDFDMARWLLDEPVAEVFAAASCCLVDPAIGEAGDVDTAKILLRTASGKICVISNSRRSGYGYDQRIEAFGAKGLVRADNVMESTVSVWGREPARPATASRTSSWTATPKPIAVRWRTSRRSCAAGERLPSVTLTASRPWPWPRRRASRRGLGQVSEALSVFLLPLREEVAAEGPRMRSHRWKPCGPFFVSAF